MHVLAAMNACAGPMTINFDT